MADIMSALVSAAKKDKGIAQLLASALANAEKSKTRTKSKGRRSSQHKVPAPGSDERKAAFAAAVVKAAEARGFTNVIPNETVLTYGKWEDRGFTVKKGEKAIRVKAPGMRGKGMPLFHKDQVEPTDDSKVVEATSATTEVPAEGALA